MDSQLSVLSPIAATGKRTIVTDDNAKKKKVEDKLLTTVFWEASKN